ncbi:MAG: hypothetical protein ACE5H3_05185 [Planctomycetota bacterium]
MTDRSESTHARATMTIVLPFGLREPRHKAAAQKVMDQLDPHVRRFLAEELEGALRRLRPARESNPSEKEAGADQPAEDRSSASSRSSTRDSSSVSAAGPSAAEATLDDGRGGPVIVCAWEWDPVQGKWVYRCHTQ